MRCNIDGCPERATNPDCKVSFFAFPKDHALKMEWIRRTGRPLGSFSTMYGKICSKHFHERDLVMGKRRLEKVKDCLPTLHLPAHVTNLDDLITDNEPQPSTSTATIVSDETETAANFIANESAADSIKDSSRRRHSNETIDAHVTGDDVPPTVDNDIVQPIGTEVEKEDNETNVQPLRSDSIVEMDFIVEMEPDSIVEMDNLPQIVVGSIVSIENKAHQMKTDHSEVSKFERETTSSIFAAPKRQLLSIENKAHQMKTDHSEVSKFESETTSSIFSAPKRQLKSSPAAVVVPITTESIPKRKSATTTSCCRLCQVETDKSISLSDTFKTFQSRETKMNVMQAVESLLNVNIQLHETMPRAVCSLCFGFLGQIYEFRKKLQLNENVLLSHTQNAIFMPVHAEPPSPPPPPPIEFVNPIKIEPLYVDELPTFKREFVDESNETISFSNDEEEEEEKVVVRSAKKAKVPESIDDDEGRLPCYLCGRRYTVLKLQYHINVHERIKPFFCHHTDCRIAFTSPHRLKKHLWIEHKEIYSLKQCLRIK